MKYKLKSNTCHQHPRLTLQKPALGAIIGKQRDHKLTTMRPICFMFQLRAPENHNVVPGNPSFANISCWLAMTSNFLTIGSKSDGGILQAIECRVVGDIY